MCVNYGQSSHNLWSGSSSLPFFHTDLGVSLYTKAPRALKYILYLNCSVAEHLRFSTDVLALCHRYLSIDRVTGCNGSDYRMTPCSEWLHTVSSPNFPFSNSLMKMHNVFWSPVSILAFAFIFIRSWWPIWYAGNWNYVTRVWRYNRVRGTVKIRQSPNFFLKES